MRFPRGSTVRVSTLKWPDRPHWNFAGRYLGADAHGDWIGYPTGSIFERPGASYVSPIDQVTLVPTDGAEPGSTGRRRRERHQTGATTQSARPDGGAQQARDRWIQAGWLATFHGRGGPLRVYIDITTPAVWQHDRVSCVDLDLDVYELPDGTVGIDDEEEFVEHQVSLAYPAEVVTNARRSCDLVHAALLDRIAPFDLDTPAHWLSELSRM